MESCDDLPRFYCKTAIYHPNIDTMQDPDGEICLNLFDPDMWTSDSSMQDIVQGLLFLIYNPNLEDPLCGVVSSTDMEEFGRDVEKSIAGGRIGDFQFPVNARYARLHPPMDKQVEDKEEEKGDEKVDERGSGKVGKDGQIDEENDGLKDGGKDGEKDGERTGLIEEVKEGDEGERTGADGCKEDIVKGTEEHLEDRYFGIKEYMTYADDDQGHDDEEDVSDEEDDEGSDSDSCMLYDDLSIDYDSDVVNDEDLFDLIDEIDDQEGHVDDENRKNLDDSDSVISWSKMVYGAENKSYVDKLQVLIEDLSTGLNNSTSSQGVFKEPGNAAGSASTGVSTRAQRTTVESRFYHALQTRAFRRWLL